MTPFLLEPRDGLTIKDGRGFNVGGGAFAHVQPWPMPATFAGATRTALGRAARLDDADRTGWRALLSIGVLGPLAVRQPAAGDWEPVFPAPADAFLARDGTLHRFKPRAPTARDAQVARVMGLDEGPAAADALWRPRLVTQGKPNDEPPPFWTRRQFLEWLRTGHATVAEIGLPTTREDAHVGIERATGRAADGILFGMETVEFLSRRPGGRAIEPWAVYGRAELRQQDLPRQWSLGGERRQAVFSVIGGQDPWEIPTWAFQGISTRRVRVVLLTPAYFERGWLPDWLAPATLSGDWMNHTWTLRSACLERPMSASGWDYAPEHGRPGPKASRRLVPAGTVYFLELTDPTAALNASDLGRLWLTTLQSPGTQHERDGLGLTVTGPWPED